jgi:hypothetical protein
MKRKISDVIVAIPFFILFGPGLILAARFVKGPGAMVMAGIYSIILWVAVIAFALWSFL